MEQGSGTGLDDQGRQRGTAPARQQQSVERARAQGADDHAQVLRVGDLIESQQAQGLRRRRGEQFTVVAMAGAVEVGGDALVLAAVSGDACQGFAAVTVDLDAARPGQFLQFGNGGITAIAVRKMQPAHLQCRIAQYFEYGLAPVDRDQPFVKALSVGVAQGVPGPSRSRR